MSGFPSFLRLNDISLSEWTTSYSAHTWVASTFWLLWAALPWTWGHKYREALFSGCISGSGVAGLYGCSTDSARRLQFLYPSLTLVIFYFFNSSSFNGYEVVLIVVLICIFPIISDVIFSYTFWPFVYDLWRNVCSSVLPIFKLGYLMFCCWVVGVLFWIYALQIFSPIL